MIHRKPALGGWVMKNYKIRVVQFIQYIGLAPTPIVSALISKGTKTSTVVLGIFHLPAKVKQTLTGWF